MGRHEEISLGNLPELQKSIRKKNRRGRQAPVDVAAGPSKKALQVFDVANAEKRKLSGRGVGEIGL